MLKINKLLVVGAAALSLMACSKEKAPETKVMEKSTINSFLGGEPKTLDPSLSTDSYSGDILINISEGLTRTEMGEDGQDVISGAGALSWEVNEDKTLWTFHLRDYKWTDGKRVKASDYVYGIRRSLDPATGSPYSYLLYPIKNAAAFNQGKIGAEALGVRAIDDSTLEIRLEKPTPYFLELTYSALMYPEREDIVEKYGDKYGTSCEFIISNGPFKVKEWEHEQRVSLEKNPLYWDSSSVSIDEINLYITRDENVRMDMLLRGEANIGEASKKEWADRFISTGRFTEFPGFSAATNYLFFNGKKGIFANENVRRAFALGINREEMSDTIYRGLFEPAYGWVAPGIDCSGQDFRTQAGSDVLTSEGDLTPREYLLKGLRELGIQNSPEEITVTYLNPSTSTWARSYSEYIAAMYKETLGINVKSDFLSWPVFEERVAKRDYELGGVAWYADYNDPSSFLEVFSKHSDISPVSWINPEYDTLLKKAATTTDPKERLELFKKAERILLRDGWVTPTVYLKRRIFTNKKVKGYFLTPFTGSDYKNVYIENIN